MQLSKNSHAGHRSFSPAAKRDDTFRPFLCQAFAGFFSAFPRVAPTVHCKSRPQFLDPTDSRTRLQYRPHKSHLAKGVSVLPVSQAVLFAAPEEGLQPPLRSALG